jgi:hypothetical protein
VPDEVRSRTLNRRTFLAQEIGQHTAELNQRLIAINVEIQVAVLDAVNLNRKCLPPEN